MLKRLNDRYFIEEFLEITHIDTNIKDNISVLHLTNGNEIVLSGVTEDDIKKFFKVK